jgi:predicted RNase H-like nuclease (RuvC/YqgF family)
MAIEGNYLLRGKQWPEDIDLVNLLPLIRELPWLEDILSEIQYLRQEEKEWEDRLVEEYENEISDLESTISEYRRRLETIRLETDI